MIFRPDRLASDAMTRFGAKHINAIERLQEYLRFTELRYAEFKTLHPDEPTQESFSRAMADLAHRIGVTVEVIAAAEATAAEANEPGDFKWSEAKPPSEWRKKLKMSQTTLKRRVDDGTLIVDKITTRSWRIRRDTLDKFMGTK